MYRYEFTSGGYEGCSWVTLSHETKFTEADLSRMMHSAMPLAVIAKANESALDHVTQVQNLWQCAIDVLKAEYGFVEEKPEATHHIFGWRDLCDNGFNEHPEANSIVEHLATQGFPQEFFQTWDEARSNTLRADDPWTRDRAFGASAGIAFRLNEFLGRRAITRVNYPDWEDDD